MKTNLQPHLEGLNTKLVPLRAEHFELLYAVARDPAVWANHPNKNRFEYEVFKNFFDGALQSGGAFLIIDNVQAKLPAVRVFMILTKLKNQFLSVILFMPVDFGEVV